MNIFLNFGLISLNNAPTIKDILLMIIENVYFDNLKSVFKSSSNTPSVQVLHQQIRGVEGQDVPQKLKILPYIVA